MQRFSLVLALLLARSTVASSQDCSSATFIRAAQFPTGDPPFALAVGDFNNDNHPDIATGSYGIGTVSILLNDGNGGFEAPQTTGFIGNVDFLAAGFFNNDGNLDLAVLTDNGNLQILLGNGDGTFQIGDAYPTDYQPYGLVTADFFGGGHVDIAVATHYGGELYVFRGNGDGTFQAPVQSPTPSLISIAAGDFDGDGLADLAASVQSGVVQIYPGNGDGTFGSPFQLKVGGNMGPIVAADFDGDGKLDVAVANDVYVAVARGNGDGTLQAGIDYLVGYFPNSIVAADLDGDGRPDLAVLREAGYSYTAGVISVLHQRPDGFFEDGGAYDVGPSAASLAAADFNGDGRSDLVSANFAFQFVSVLFSNGDGSLRATTRVTLPGAPGASPVSLVVNDFTSDVRPDIAVLETNPSAVVVVAREETGRFRTLTTTPLDGNPVTMAAGGFNADTHVDLAIADNYDGFDVLLGHGDGTFDAPVGYASGISVSALAVADFTGDGILDIAVVEPQNPSFPGQITVFVGQGDGTFVEGPSTPLTHQVSSILAHNIDPNFTLDLVTTNPADNSVSVFRGNGDGTFQAPVDYPTGPTPVAAAAAPIFSDQRIDLAVADASSSNVSLLVNDGAGGFQAPILIGIGFIPTSIVAVDVDGNGRYDIVTANNQTSNVSLLLQNLDHTFQAPQTYSVEQNPISLAFGNLGGAAMDVVVGNQYGNSLSVLENARLTAYVLSPAPAIVGTPLSMTAFASGFGPLTYQWRRNGLPLVDGGAISGANTATLTIDPVSFGDAGTYDVSVIDSCTSALSNSVVLAVEFADVPTSSIFHADIIKVATDGITAGCGGSNYCPTNTVRRDQMAVFLLKSEHGSAYIPPACSGVFADVPCPGPFTDWVERLAAEGVTGGCGGGDYCPASPVTRAQMAVFLLKTLLGAGYTPPPAVGIFGDVPVGSFAADFIEDLYNRGITGGCSTSPLLYCPTGSVLRQQMATLLVRTFSLP